MAESKIPKHITMMRKIYNYLFAIAFCASITSCLEEFGSDRPTANGEEVQFGLSLETPETKTVYGPESGNAFPIYWSEGDKVLVASPQCGRNNAEYQVTPVANQSYAEAMTRLGDYGVQWGSTAADFYSIYPSAGTTWQNLERGNVTAKLNISSRQSANLLLEGNVYNAADMNNIIMYARTPNVENGKTVNLNYKPYSTVLEFEMSVSKLANGRYGTATVESMTLTAPEGVAIAGDFTLQFNGNEAPIIAASGNNTNRISMVFTTKPVLNNDNNVCKAKFAVLPINGIVIGTDEDNSWTVSIDVIEGSENKKKTYTKTLKIGAELAPGMIHKITLPKFAPADEWKPSGDSWISSMYDYESIYLTEFSIPGAWYAGGKVYGNNEKPERNYQATDQIKPLWDAGVRAFAVECRTATSGRYNTTPSAVVVSGTGSNPNIGSHYYDGTKIRTIIKNVADQVAGKNEFAVLVLSYADGGDNGHRDQDHAYFINGIKTEISSSGATNIYYSEDEKGVNANTTVAEVKGQLIIVVNVDDDIPIGSYNSNNGMNALLTYTPFLQQLKDKGANIDYSEPFFSKLHWKEWSDSYKFTSTEVDHINFTWCFSSANRTQLNTGTSSELPKYSERQAALRAMIEHSKEISSNNHNVWFYFNAGGTQTTSLESTTTSATDFAKTMNPWLYDIIRLKSDGGQDVNGVFGNANAYFQSDPSPLGIVMFNQCTGDDSVYYGERIINAIIQMNNKFELKRKGYVGDSSVGVDNWDIELL